MEFTLGGKPDNVLPSKAALAEKHKVSGHTLNAFQLEKLQPR
jgi:hypothetical protein